MLTTKILSHVEGDTMTSDSKWRRIGISATAAVDEDGPHVLWSERRAGRAFGRTHRVRTETPEATAHQIVDRFLAEHGV
jgi:hypothetical protein